METPPVEVLKMYFLCKMVIFHCHVSFRGCTVYSEKPRASPFSSSFGGATLQATRKVIRSGDKKVGRLWVVQGVGGKART